MTNSETVSLLMNSQYYKQGYQQGVFDVLDKIRDEIIDAFAPSICSEESGCLEQLLGIIDKYRGDEHD